MTAIGVFPIKRRSRRCPDKNFQDLGGVELWEWSFRAMLMALKHGTLDKIVVSACPDVMDGRPEEEQSFANRVRELAMIAGIDQDQLLISVRETMCGDDDTAHDFLYLIDEQMREKAGVVDDDVYIFTHPCNPFVTSGLMAIVRDRAEPGRNNGDHRSVIAATELKQKLWEKNAAGESRSVNHDPFKMVPTQDLSTLFIETVAMYGYTSATINKLKSHQGYFPELLVADPITLWDIDEPWELEIARAIVETGRRKLAFGAE